MLTRHWYDRDSVGEALFQAAGAWRDPLRKQKLIFWSYELVLSEELDYLWEILERVGKRWGSSATMATLSTKDPLHFLQALLSLPTPAPYDPPTASSEEDSAQVHVGITSAPDVPTAWTAGQRHRLWVAVQDAVTHKRSLRLLRLLGALPSQVAAKYLGYTGGEKSLYTMLEMKGIPILLTSVSVSWPQLPIGRCAARLFSVPRAHAPTGPVSPLATKEGCKFWRRVWGTVQCAEDEEAFWATYFADDIPDEWSAVEQAKSHHVLAT
jgi:hypothetical protein